MKLAVSQPGDPLEREADRVAEQVTSADPSLAVARSASGNDGRTSPASAPPSVIGPLGSGGEPLSEAVRAEFEPRFGRDFSGVRVHTDSTAQSSARNVQALAYTVGNDISFAPGQYAPATAGGRRLIAHELTHVAQGAPGIHRQPAPGVADAGPSTTGPGAPYRLELSNPLSDVEAHASTYELLPALVARLSKAHNIDEALAWRLLEWTAAGLGMMTWMTYSHEQGGHGGAARRVGGRPDITLHAPWSGEAAPNFPAGVTDDQKLAVTAGGVNQESINASRMASRWALRGDISHQEAMAYLYAQTNLAAYAARTFALSITASKDDVYSYVTKQGSLSVGELMALAAVADLLSGPAWAALLGQWNYISRGERRVSIPTFKVGREMRATIPNWQLLLSSRGPLLGGRSTINVGGRFPVEVSLDASLDEPGIAVGAQLHAPITPKLTLSPFGRASLSEGEGRGGVLGLDFNYKLSSLVGISGSISYREDDLLAQPEATGEGWAGRAALTLTFK